MTNASLQVGNQVIVQRQHLQGMLDILSGNGYELLGPTLRDSAVVYDEIETVEDLPIGWTDHQDGGHYKLQERHDEALFGFTVGPQSWKQFLHPPMRRLWQATRNPDDGSIAIQEEQYDLPKRAFIGVRACELHAMEIQKKVFTGGEFIDPLYKALYDNVFTVAVNCGKSGGTCFCTSMNTGPKSTFGFDLALTEIIEPDHHVFLVEVGTPKGADVLQQVPFEQAHEHDLARAQQIVEQTARHMGRTMNTTNIKEFLYANFDHPRWEAVANRCLSCTNCTTVCPTCFCVTTEDVTDLSGDQSERWQRWDSCFTLDFSYIHGGSVRSSSKSRYRQWMTHKLASWIDQFDTSGCVGCGRCITWCPVGIDITEEMHAIRDSGETTARAELSSLNMV